MGDSEAAGNAGAFDVRGASTPTPDDEPATTQHAPQHAPQHAEAAGNAGAFDVRGASTPTPDDEPAERDLDALLDGSEPAPEPAAQTYTVVSGDTLWAIAERYYGDGSKYQQIADASGIANPDLIYPGQVLTIP